MRSFSDKQTLIWFYRLPVFILCIFIFWQSCYPGIISKPLFPCDDKVMHFGVYAFLAMLSARDLKKEKYFISLSKITIIIVFFVSLYGLSDEIHQAFVPSRSASVYDFLADCAGSVAGCLVYLHILSAWV